MNRQAWIDEFAGKKILIWGFGREGQSSLKWIRNLCPELPVVIADSGSSKALEEAAQAPFTTVLKEADVDFSVYDRITMESLSPEPYYTRSAAAAQKIADCAALMAQNDLFLQLLGRSFCYGCA